MQRSTIKALTALMEEILEQTTCGAAPVTSLSSEQLRDTLGRTNWSKNQRFIPIASPLATPEHLVEELVGKLREALADFIDTGNDRIGHAFPLLCPSTSVLTSGNGGVVAYEQESTVSDFAKGVIWHAAVLGSTHAVELLIRSKQGEPFRYRTAALLLGVTVEGPLDLDNGVRVIPLPKSVDALPVTLPKTLSMSGVDYLGKAVLYIDSEVHPALFSVRGSRTSDEDPKPRWVRVDASLYSLYEALSLICNGYVYSELHWCDYDEESAMAFEVSGNSSVRTGTVFDYRQFAGWLDDPSIEAKPPRKGVAPVSVAKLSLEDLHKAWEIHAVLDARKRIGRRFRVAVHRWFRSMRPDLELTDYFIDLRIALEALYIDNNQGELRFRLAVNGAWHVGRNPAERRKIKKMLTKFYDAASRIIHGGEFDEAKDDHEWLDQARDICRRGILKALEVQEEPDWDGLILGCDIE